MKPAARQSGESDVPPELLWAKIEQNEKWVAPPSQFCEKWDSPLADPEGHFGVPEKEDIQQRVLGVGVIS